MNYEKLFASHPANKQAAMVTFSKIVDENELEYLIKQSQYLMNAIKTAKTHRHLNLVDVKKMGQELQEVNTKINKLKASVGKEKKKLVANAFMDVCREELSAQQFKNLINKTYQKIKESDLT